MNQESENLIIDLAALRSAHTTMKTKFLKIINYYFEDTETYLDVITTGLMKGDINQIISALHTIKSSSKQLGADVMAAEAAEIEAYSRIVLMENSGMSPLKEKIDKLKKTYEITKYQMELAIKELFYKITKISNQQT